MHAKSFNDQKNGNGQMQGVNGQAPTSVPVPATIAQPQPDINAMTQFGEITLDVSLLLEKSRVQY